MRKRAVAAHHSAPYCDCNHHAELALTLPISREADTLPSVALPPGKTDEDYVLALLRETGILCVHGSGFGMRPEDGFLRIVFLADPDKLAVIYSDMAAFTGDFLRRS